MSVNKKFRFNSEQNQLDYYHKKIDDLQERLKKCEQQKKDALKLLNKFLCYN